MDPLQLLLDTTLYFRLANLTSTEIIDLLLVTVAFYLLLRLVRYSRSALLLRGVLILSGILFIITIILPLPAFDWLVRGALIAVLVATPIIFQPELRRLLERIGRNVGMTRDVVRRTAVEQVLPSLVRAVENMAASYTGALITLEGNTSLQDVIETGVPIGGQATSELLQTIFYSNNPLHDGAVILREEKVVAAGCVLPITQRPLNFRRRLGTRHRAAIGISEQSDALVIVVSEETGDISVAREGELHCAVDIASLRKHFFDFYAPATSNASPPSMWRLLGRSGRQLLRNQSLPTLPQLLANLGLLAISLVLAAATWSFVIQRTNPATRLRFENIPLQIQNIPQNALLVSQPPTTVAAVVETTDRIRPTLSSASFQAMVSLEGLLPGLHHLPIQVTSGASPVRVLRADPLALDLELAPIISRSVEVSVDMTGQQNLSRAYQVVGMPVAIPDRVEVKGAEPLVNQISQVQARISVANASTSIQETSSLRALDANGREVTDVIVQPDQVQVQVSIERRVDARDVGVRVVTKGTPASGYWLSALNVSPSSVTLQGDPERLTQMEGFIDTLPVDLTDAVGNISLQIPLDLPPELQAVDSNGNTTRTVAVQAQVTPRRGNLAITRRVELIGVSPGITKTIVSPIRVDVLLTGPLPTLNTVEENSELVQVTVDASNLIRGQSQDLIPIVIAPDDVQAQVVPPNISVTFP